VIEIGSSDSAAILGVSPRETPWQAWARLVGLLPEPPEEELMEWGKILEDTVLREFCLRERWVIEKQQAQYHHRSKPWLRATPDGLILRYEKGEDRAVLALAEVKCVIGHVPDVPRVDWLVQCCHQRLVAESVEQDVSEQYLIAFGGLRMVWWEVPRHVGAMDRILREEEKFLELVEKQTPPPVRAADASALNKAWPWAEAKTVELPDSLLQADRDIALVDVLMAEWGSLRDRSEAQIKAAMGDATKGTLSNGVTYTWAPHSRKEYVVKANRVRPFKRHGRKDDEA
jgi:predicted phage-related endonuclease